MSNNFTTDNTSNFNLNFQGFEPSAPLEDFTKNLYPPPYLNSQPTDRLQKALDELNKHTDNICSTTKDLKFQDSSLLQNLTYQNLTLNNCTLKDITLIDCTTQNCTIIDCNLTSCKIYNGLVKFSTLSDCHIDSALVSFCDIQKNRK